MLFVPLVSELGLLAIQRLITSHSHNYAVYYFTIMMMKSLKSFDYLMYCVCYVPTM